MSPVMDFMSGAIKDRKKTAVNDNEQKTITDKTGKIKGQKETQKLYDKVITDHAMYICQTKEPGAIKKGTAKQSRINDIITLLI